MLNLIRASRFAEAAEALNEADRHGAWSDFNFQEDVARTLVYGVMGDLQRGRRIAQDAADRWRQRGVQRIGLPRQSGHGVAWEALVPWEAQIRDWVGEELQLTNVHWKLTRRGVVVPYRTLHRSSVPDTEPGP